MTPTVLLLLLTRTARIATPMMATATVTTLVMSWSVMFFPPKFYGQYCTPSTVVHPKFTLLLAVPVLDGPPLITDATVDGPHVLPPPIAAFNAHAKPPLRAPATLAVLLPF